MDRTSSSCPNSHNGQTGLVQTASACSVSAGCGTETTGQSQGNAQGPRDGQGSVFKQEGPQFTPVFLMSRLGSHGLGVCYPSQAIKPDWGEPRECSPPPASSSQQ